MSTTTNGKYGDIVASSPRFPITARVDTTANRTAPAAHFQPRIGKTTAQVGLVLIGAIGVYGGVACMYAAASIAVTGPRDLFVAAWTGPRPPGAGDRPSAARLHCRCRRGQSAAAPCSPSMQESTKLRLEGNWNEWKGRLRSQWAELTNDDLDEVQGNVQQLIGVIQQRTGENLDDVHAKLDEMVREARND